MQALGCSSLFGQRVAVRPQQARKPRAALRVAAKKTADGPTIAIVGVTGAVGQVRGGADPAGRWGHPKHPWAGVTEPFPVLLFAGIPARE